jgi:hypothetical protein
MVGGGRNLSGGAGGHAQRHVRRARLRGDARGRHRHHRRHGRLPGQPATGSYDRILGIVGIALEAAVVLLAAWRFRKGRGWLAGGIALALFVIEIGFKLMSGFLGIAWYVAYLAVFLALVNGVRGAWALRDMGEEPTDLSDTFA